METIRCVRVKVFGRVQGVGFRHVALREARSLGISGWVANLPDGTVELEIQGPPHAVETMIAWCGRGPATAHVRQIQISERPPQKNMFPFSIIMF